MLPKTRVIRAFTTFMAVMQKKTLLHNSSSYNRCLGLIYSLTDVSISYATPRSAGGLKNCINIAKGVQITGKKNTKILNPSIEKNIGKSLLFSITGKLLNGSKRGLTG